MIQAIEASLASIDSKKFLIENKTVNISQRLKFVFLDEQMDWFAESNSVPKREPFNLSALKIDDQPGTSILFSWRFTLRLIIDSSFRVLSCLTGKSSLELAKNFEKIENKILVQKN